MLPSASKPSMTECWLHAQRPGSSPTKLYEYYLSFGEDPANSRLEAPLRHVMAGSVDRLGRSLQVSELHALGIDLFLHQEGLDTTTPAGRQNTPCSITWIKSRPCNSPER
jgi:hypothetical protein